jgi:hypothetical protein
MQASSECITQLIQPDKKPLQNPLFAQFLYQAQILILEILN